MTDQDWDVDREAGGAADEGDDLPGRAAPADAGATRAVSDERSAKVVPFPGNWFGAVEDLVPIYPDPVPLRAEPVRSVVDVATPPIHSSSTSAADASDFWEGDAATLQELSDETDSPSSIALLRSSAAASRRTSARGGAADPTARVERERADADPSAPDRSRARIPAVVGLLAAAVIAGGLLATQLIPGAARSGAKRGQSGAATATEHRPPAVTITSSVTVTTKAKPRTRRHHASRADGVRTTAATVKKPSNAALVGSAGSGPGGPSTAQSSTQESSTSDVSSGSTAPPTPSKSASGSNSASGSGCAAQSPDSGCRP